MSIVRQTECWTRTTRLTWNPGRGRVGGFTALGATCVEVGIGNTRAKRAFHCSRYPMVTVLRSGLLRRRRIGVT